MFGVGVILVVVLGGVAVLALAARLLAAVFAPVERKRLERFALRQAIRITPANGAVVIRYLATTRRWRGGLLLLTLVGSVLFYFIVRRRAVDFSAVAGFAGWFVGAVVAEWRLNALPRGPRSSASLYRRNTLDYVARAVLVPAIVLWLCVPVLSVAALVAGLGRSAGVLSALADLVGVLVAGAAMVLVVRRILTRPQPLVAADLLAADNAIRGRSLNVLTGAALAIGGYLGAASLGELIGNTGSPATQLVNLVGIAALPILGVVVAVRPRVVPVLHPAPIAA